MTHVYDEKHLQKDFLTCFYIIFIHPLPLLELTYDSSSNFIFILVNYKDIRYMQK